MLRAKKWDKKDRRITKYDARRNLIIATRKLGTLNLGEWSIIQPEEKRIFKIREQSLSSNSLIYREWVGRVYR